MKRYRQLNDYYIEDTYTGQKLDQKRTIRRLNQYETILQKEFNEEALNESIESNTTRN